MENWEKKIKSPLLPTVLFAVCLVWGVVGMMLNCIESLWMLEESVELAVAAVLSILGGIFQGMIPASLAALIALFYVARTKKKGWPLIVCGAVILLAHIEIGFVFLAAALACVAFRLLGENKKVNIASNLKLLQIGFPIAVGVFALTGLSVSLVSGVGIATLYEFSPEGIRQGLTIAVPEMLRYLLFSAALLLGGWWMVSFRAEENEDGVYEDDTAVHVGSETDVSEEKKNTYFVSPLVHICLLLFTCGIWQLIWIYKTTEFTNRVEGEEGRNAVIELLLCMFVPFYLIYWVYRTASLLDKLAAEKSVASDLTVVCLLCALFFPLAAYILLQLKINEIVEKSDASPFIEV